MGIFSKLFGGTSPKPDSGSAPTGGTGFLHTSRTGGYDKMSVLQRVDALNGELFALETALEAKKKGEPFRLPPPGPRPELVPTKMGGFSQEDVTAYLDQLEVKIQELRDSLNA